MTSEELDALFEQKLHVSTLLIITALREPNITTEHVIKAARHPNWEVRLSAFNHRLIPKKAFEESIYDEDWLIRDKAIRVCNDLRTLCIVAKNDEFTPNKKIAASRIMTLLNVKLRVFLA